MEHYEMAELLSKKAGVSLERARRALAECDWDMLDAMIALEREKRAEPVTVTVGADTDSGACAGPETEPQPVKGPAGHKGAKEGFDRVWEAVKRLFRMSLENCFVILRRDKPLLTMPVLALAALLVCCFWFTLPMLVVGLFFGCSYHFEKCGGASENAGGASEKQS